MIGDPVIADAIRDRLEHAALTLNITGESYRGVKARKVTVRSWPHCRATAETEMIRAHR